jgi:hypothetical protein
MQVNGTSDPEVYFEHPLRSIDLHSIKKQVPADVQCWTSPRRARIEVVRNLSTALGN